MKINKLFHWLYGALMCLPLLGVLFTSLYVTFNPNASDSSSMTTLVYQKVNYSTNEVNSYDDLIIGNAYEFNLVNTSGFTWEDIYQNEDLVYYQFTIEPLYLNINTDDYFFDEFLTPLVIDKQFDSFKLVIYLNFNSVSLRNDGYYYDDEGFSLSFEHLYNDEMPYENRFGFILTSDIKEELDYIYEYDVSITSFFYPCDLSRCIDTYDLKEVENLDNAFTYAINDINNNPLYNWAQNSFLVAPIAFVTGLFGLTQTSPVVTLLSYWLTISIVWLVFDLIMYIPLLVHRWLDKGVIS